MSDKAVTIEVLIKVIDAAKVAGIDKFTIQTEKEKQDK
jgi:biopolymer transport protein ExbD